MRGGPWQEQSGLVGVAASLGPGGAEVFLTQGRHPVAQLKVHLGLAAHCSRRCNWAKDNFDRPNHPTQMICCLKPIPLCLSMSESGTIGCAIIPAAH